jgi:hypothetical protein
MPNLHDDHLLPVGHLHPVYRKGENDRNNNCKNRKFIIY